MRYVKTAWWTAGLLCLVLWPAAAHGQSPELREAMQRSSELAGEGRFEEAVRIAEKAVALSEREFGAGHPGTGHTLVITSVRLKIE